MSRHLSEQVTPLEVGIVALVLCVVLWVASLGGYDGDPVADVASCVERGGTPIVGHSKRGHGITRVDCAMPPPKAPQ